MEKMMTSIRKPTAGFWITVAMVAVLVPFCGYIGAYLCMVRQPTNLFLSGHGPWETTPVYSSDLIGQGFWRTLFGPAHWLDKQIRPDEWVIR
jgi:hypothetical protein